MHKPSNENETQTNFLRQTEKIKFCARDKGAYNANTRKNSQTTLTLLSSTLTLHHGKTTWQKSQSNTIVPQMTTKEEQSGTVKRSLTKTMMEVKYPGSEGLIQ